MKINAHGYTDQFEQFVAFANNQRNPASSTAVAQADAPLRGRTVRSISENRDDHVGATGRSADVIKNNNTARALFLESVADIFGGKDHIPAQVRKALVMDDYKAVGKPLTARRILAVKAAVDAWKLRGDLSHEDHVMLAASRKVDDFLSTALGEVVNRVPFTRADAEALRRTAEALPTRLAKLLDELADMRDELGAEVVDSMQNQLRETYQKAVEKAADVANWFAGLPDSLSDENVKEFRAGWAAAATNLFSAYVPDEARQAVFKAKADALIDMPIPADRDSKEFGKFMLGTSSGFVALLKAEFARAGIQVPKGLAKLLTKAWETVLNKGDWNPIRTSFQIPAEGRGKTTVESDITPAYHIDPQLKESYDGDGIKGVMCHSFSESNHAVNLNRSSLKIGGETVFCGFRHGVHSAMELRGQARTDANLARAKETALAMVLSDPAKRNAAIQDGFVEFHITSVSLLTPDFLRAMKTNGTSNERSMLQQQSEAWDAAYNGGQGFTAIIKDDEGNEHEVHIIPKTTKFNFGVNEGAVRWYGGLLSSWGVSGSLNNPAWADLKQRALAFANNHRTDPYKAQCARTLVRQIDDILTEGKERSDEHDAYKAAARIAVLTNLMGDVPAWNCKSGKDRTGELDVEVKFLSTLIHQHKPIPKPGAPLTDEQKHLFATFAFKGGNFEVQKYNTGLAGFKTGGVASIPERLGGAEMRKIHAGGSSFVKV